MTRTKICGITRVEDALTCAQAGADAIGLVFYAKSPRAVAIDQAAGILRALPPFITSVALFVDPEPDWVRSVVSQARPDLLQFHGDEAADFCQAFGRPYIKAVRVRPETDLLQSAALYGEARALLLDAYSPQAHGGTGQSFDWGLIPRRLPKPIVLAGGLDPDNVAAAIRQARPWAVDVSSGVEAADGSRKGIKDAARIRAFMDAVRMTETAEKEVGDADV